MAILRNTNRQANDNESDKTYSKINKKFDILDQKMNSLYSDIYISRPDNRQNIDKTINDLDIALDKLQDTEAISTSNMSELIKRVSYSKNGNDVDKLTQEVESLFTNTGLLDTLYQNDTMYKYIAAQNYQYDLICKYLPKLQDALDVKRDNVLCSDNFSKNFINPKSNKSSKSEVELFATNTKRLEQNYNISKFLEETYRNVQKYGEDFIYIVPYDVALERLLRVKNQTNITSLSDTSSFFTEDSIENLLKENSNYSNFKEYIEESDIEFNDSFKSSLERVSVRLHFNDSNAVLENIEEMTVLDSKSQLEKLHSLASIHESSIESSSVTDQYNKSRKKNDLTSTSNDGLIVPSEFESKDDSGKLKNINGAVVERLPRENVIPIYIGNRCLGYYYLQFYDNNRCEYCGGRHGVASNGLNNSFEAQTSEEQNDLMIQYIASKISSKIDSHFINANKDLKEDIYAVLRYNEKFNTRGSNEIGITFIPAQDIIHCYSELDERTHRGISALHKSIIPAMLYILLYLTDIIGKITRSTDKRIYYVKQNVETNVARTMMNVVQQIKKGNMGMRQIETMNNIFNIVGKYNDYIIPIGQSGDAPIQFEVMNGQEIQTPTEIMDKMEDAAVSAIVPIEMVNSTYQQDFAVRFSMSNTRFLKSIYTDQRATEKYFSLIYTKIYNYEYSENNKEIPIILPPPTYLTMTNNQQLIDNITQLADKIIDLELADEEDEIRTEFKKLYVRSYLSTYINFDDIERLKEQAKVNIEIAKPAATENGEASDSSFGTEY